MPRVPLFARKNSGSSRTAAACRRDTGVRSYTLNITLHGARSQAVLPAVLPAVWPSGRYCDGHTDSPSCTPSARRPKSASGRGQQQPRRRRRRRPAGPAAPDRRRHRPDPRPSPGRPRQPFTLHHSPIPAQSATIMDGQRVPVPVRRRAGRGRTRGWPCAARCPRRPDSRRRDASR